MNLIVHGEDIKTVSNEDYQAVMSYTTQMQRFKEKEG